MSNTIDRDEPKPPRKQPREKRPEHEDDQNGWSRVGPEPSVREGYQSRGPAVGADNSNLEISSPIAGLLLRV
jgi:hypothetical protein